jgi:hypothetical protein
MDAQSMKVMIETEGGIAGGLDLPPLVVDSDYLGTEDAKELARLVAAAKAETVAKGTVRLGEKITVEDAGVTTHLARSLADLSGSPAFSALRNWVRSKATS